MKALLKLLASGHYLRVRALNDTGANWQLRGRNQVLRANGRIIQYGYQLSKWHYRTAHKAGKQALAGANLHQLLMPYQGIVALQPAHDHHVPLPDEPALKKQLK